MGKDLLIDVTSVLRWSTRGIAKTETQASSEVFQTRQHQGHPDGPPTIADGWGGIDEAIVHVDGRVPAYCGRGRPPTHKKPGAAQQYLQIVRLRDDHGKLQGVKLRVVFGTPAEVLALVGKSTAYIERSHLTSRLFNGRQVRKTVAFSKSIVDYQASAI